MLELLFLLLPVAAAYGWYMGRNSIKQNDQTAKADLSKKYSQGINYLLSNQQDKAIAHLIETLQVEDESIDAHFAMANLFRKRGELDRALKVHEHLVRHKYLPDSAKRKAAFELGKDFFSAGLFDRAEAMFVRLLKSKHYELKALSYLLQIYQSTKDWQKGITLEKNIIKSNDKKLLHVLANFYCELAMQARSDDDNIEVIELLEKALELDNKSCRANCLMAEVYEQNEQYDHAINCYMEIYQQDTEFFPEVIDKLEFCFEQNNDQAAFFDFIKKVYSETGSTSALIKYVDLLIAQGKVDQANQFILTAMKRRSTIRGFRHFVKMQLSANNTPQESESLKVIRELVSEYLKVKPRYSCRNCGFNSSTHYWSCPSCHEWEQLKPVRGLEGE
ncbi:lipopolysaccharide assembly protein LapB [Thalassotalea sp. LPB0316]|uniref:lipopolysaccharide assembly protein LapB n=1 Tax=Thalassotalea sp. LPB0316 TaxID=2769490 RepID=UPI001866E784|nr:lipopolysaccharide assembly protein LapB [Thalassotalea sp. LPB0316]QOL24796.1 lipopolysaccharide assembly protein LapB [Thalassotalea sp. LPB0316]